MRTLILFLLLASCPLLPAAEVRRALVMGVWQYTDPKFAALPGIESDVAKMAAKLRELGFEVTVASNPTLGQAKTAVDDFGARLKAAGPEGVGLFYFTGHGTENDGKNYLVPRGTKITSRGDLDDEALSAQRVLTRMEEAGNKVNLVFLDCCRSALSKGSGDLAPMSASGTFIGFATASATEAGASDDGSAYTLALVENLGTPGVSITDVHTRVTRRVKELTDGTQRPFQYSGLDDVYYLMPKGAVIEPSTAPMPGTPARVLRPSPAKTAPRFNAAAPDQKADPDQLIFGVKEYLRLNMDARPGTEPGIDFTFASVDSPARLIFRAITPNYPLAPGVLFPKLGRFCPLPDALGELLKGASDDGGDSLLPGWVIQSSLYDFDNDGNPEVVVALNKWDEKEKLWDVGMTLRVQVYSFRAPLAEEDLDREENWRLAGHVEGQFVSVVQKDELFLPIGSQGSGNTYIFRGGRMVEDNDVTTTFKSSTSKTSTPTTAPPAPAPAAGEAELQRKLQQAVTDYVSSGNSRQSLEHELSFFAGKVDYFDQGPKTLPQIRTDISTYRTRWPTRTYRLTRINQLTVHAATDSGVALYEFEYEVANGSKKRTGRGSTRVTFGSLSTTPKVTAVKEEKLQSK